YLDSAAILSTEVDSFGVTVRYIRRTDKPPVLTQSCRIRSVSRFGRFYTGKAFYACNRLSSLGNVPCKTVSLYRSRVPNALYSVYHRCVGLSNMNFCEDYLVECDLERPKVWLKAGGEAWVLVHIEVQSGYEAEFEERIYTYNYRAYD